MDSQFFDTQIEDLYLENQILQQFTEQHIKLIAVNGLLFDIVFQCLSERSSQDTSNLVIHKQQQEINLLNTEIRNLKRKIAFME